MKKTIETKLSDEIAIIKSIDYDMIDCGNYDFWGPVYIGDIENPELADKLLRRSQGKIFAMMKSVGLPLDGWNMFDAFIWNVGKKGIAGAYRLALANK